MLQLTPAALRPHIGVSVDVDSFEALLETGDFNETARYLVRQPDVLDIDPADGVRPVAARISCSVLNRNVEGFGDTIGEAVLDAWTAGLLALRAEPGVDLVSRKASRARRQPSTTD